MVVESFEVVAGRSNCSHNYELFTVNDNSKTAKYDMIHAYLCSRPTSVRQDQGDFPIQFSIYTNCVLNDVFSAWGACGQPSHYQRQNLL